MAADVVPAVLTGIAVVPAASSEAGEIPELRSVPTVRGTSSEVPEVPSGVAEVPVAAVTQQR